MAKIVIAEDEPDIRQLVLFTLQFAGHTVIPTANGEEALNTVQKVLPELVLLDIRMPRLSGFEVCRAIKSDPRTQHIPVLFVSAKGQDADIQMGMEAGATDYVLKPFSPDDLIQRVKNALGK
jgi:CheY-like chemotaxis protein